VFPLVPTARDLLLGVVAQPYLSVVVTTRNDDHGGNPLGRTQAFINGLIGQCRRHRLQAELIIVEWNPPADRPPLVNVLNWPDDEGFCDVRIIQVPPELHQRFHHWQAMPLYQMIGKNVGIRRSRGEYVLATNIDILFSDELMRFIAEKRLQPGKMYRVNRWDVMADVPVNGSVEEQLAYCETHLIRLNAREGTFRVGQDGMRLLEANDIASPTGPVKLGGGWFERELSGDEPFRWADNDAEFIISPASHPRLLVLDVEPGPGVNMGPLPLELRDDTGKVMAEIRVKRRSVVTFALPVSESEPIRVCLHTQEGGYRIRTDLRTLNFRIFRCRVEPAPKGGSNPVASIEAVGAKLIATEGFFSRLGRVLRTLREIWRGNPEVQIRLPMSRQRMDKLRLTQDGGGLSFSASGLRAGVTDDLLPVGMRAIWGAGWYPLEYYSGEIFRWMSESGEVVWQPPSGLSGGFVLHVEPGPAIGFKACEVEIRNQWGEIIDVQNVSGRTGIRISLDHVSGPFVTSFRVRGGEPPKKGADTRSLVLRLLRCEWDVEDLDEGSIAPELQVVGAGIWSGRGWCPFNRRQGSKGLAALRDAELVLRVPDGPKRALILDVAPGPRAGPLELLIEDSMGQIAFRHNLAKAQLIRLKKVFEGGSYYTLRLRDAARERDTAPSGEPILAIAGVQWDHQENDAGSSVRVVLHPSAPDQAIQLHTNASGDFTMLARSHWMDLRAYPELDLFSMNIDTAFCWTAHHGGALEEMLEDPFRIYHIEHGSGSGWTPEGAQALFDRTAAKGIPWVDHKEVGEWGRIMNRFDAPMIFNHEDWGFANDVLAEVSPRARAVTR
jgi:hypothetical protein